MRATIKNKIIKKTLQAMHEFGYNNLTKDELVKNKPLLLFFEGILKSADLTPEQIREVMEHLNDVQK